MQASTILMLGIGLPLLGCKKEFVSIENSFVSFHCNYKSNDLQWLSSLITEESATYENGEFCLYQCRDHLGISVLTDTTERSPTFSLAPFESQLDSMILPSLCNFSYETISDNKTSWEYLLGRQPRAIDWEHVRTKTSLAKLLGYEISSNIRSMRQKYLNASEHRFRIQLENDQLVFEFKEKRQVAPVENKETLLTHVYLKMILNIHSTLVIGRLGRFQSNVMTWVRSSNNKLIDRTARNVSYLLQDQLSSPTYEEIIHRIFELQATIGSDEPLVNKVTESFQNQT